MVSGILQLHNKQIPHIIGRYQTTLNFLKQTYNVEIDVKKNKIFISGDEINVMDATSYMKKLILQSYEAYPHPITTKTFYDTSLKYSVVQTGGVYSIHMSGTPRFRLDKLLSYLSGFNGKIQILFGRKVYYGIIPKMLEPSRSIEFDKYLTDKRVRTTFVRSIHKSFVDRLQLPPLDNSYDVASVHFIHKKKGRISCHVGISDNKLHPIGVHTTHKKHLFMDLPLSTDRTIRVKVDQITTDTEDKSYLKYINHENGSVTIKQSNNVIPETVRIKQHYVYKFNGFSLTITHVNDHIEMMLSKIEDLSAAINYAIHIASL